jgi:TonB family protein
MRFHLVVACGISVAAHMAFFLLVFVPLPRLPFPPETLAEVEVIRAEIPAPVPLQAPSPQSLSAAPPASALPLYDASRIPQPNMQQIDGAIERMSAGLTIQLAAPQLALPEHRSDVTAEPLPPVLPDAAGVATEILEASPLPTGMPAAVETGSGLGQVRLGERRSPSRPRVPQVDPTFVAPPPPLASLPVTLPPLESAYGIEGPVAQREPLFRPALPAVKVPGESTIALKFWVRPDGVVTRIVPERKGDAVLEAAAIRYLEGWRFTPLASHEPQEEQWGTITIRFLPPTR